MEEKFSDALIALYVHLEQTKKGGYAPKTVAEAKFLCPQYFTPEAEAILISGWAEINQ